MCHSCDQAAGLSCVPINTAAARLHIDANDTWKICSRQNKKFQFNARNKFDGDIIKILGILSRDLFVRL